jgi:uncharacterized protein (TIRG00374 family)
MASSPTRLRSRRRVVLGILVAAAALVVVFHGTDWQQLGRILAGAQLWLLGLSVVSSLVGIGLRSFRWRLLFWPSHRMPNRPVFDAMAVGYLVNNLVPARLGDAVRCYLLARWAPVGVVHGLSATFLERVVDALAMVLLLFGLLTVLPLPAAIAWGGAVIGVGVIAVLAAFLALGARRERGGEAVARFLARWLRLDRGRWAERWSGLFASCQAVQRPRVVARLFLWSVVIWSQNLFTFWLVMVALGLWPSLAEVALAMVASALGLAVVAAPSGLGTFEAAVVASLVLVAVNPDLARGIALALHANLFVASGLAGGWAVVTRGLAGGAARRKVWSEVGSIAP